MTHARPSRFRGWSKEIWFCWNLSIIFSVASHSVDDEVPLTLKSEWTSSAENISWSVERKIMDIQSDELSLLPTHSRDDVVATYRPLPHQSFPWFSRHRDGTLLFPGDNLALEESGGRTSPISFIFLLPSIILELASIGALVVFSPLIALGFALSSFLGIIAYTALF